MYSSTSPQRYTRRNLELLESDPYNPIIVQDLLQGTSEWVNIQDIVKLTFKALFDVVKSHGEAIKELERQVPTKASKAELNSGLSMKANISDVSRTVAEVATNIESRVTLDDLQAFLDEKVARSDLQYLLSNKVSIEEVRTLLETKSNSHELNLELQALNSRIEEVYRDTIKKISGCATQRDLNQLTGQVEQKANLVDINESLAEKANKQSVANALHRKANRAEIDGLLARKADINDIQKILAALESKAEQSAFEGIGKVLESKADRSELNYISNAISHKTDKTDLDLYTSAIASQKLDAEQKLNQIEKEVHALLSSFERDMDNMRTTFSANIGKKADQKELDIMSSQITRKADIEHVSSMISQIKSEVYDNLNQFKSENGHARRQFEDTIYDKNNRAELTSERAIEEVSRLREHVKALADDRRSDIEETARYIKNITSNYKQETLQDTNKLSAEIDKLKREVDDIDAKKCEKKELLETKGKIMAAIEPKVDLSEVQGALTACQTDLNGRLMDLKEDFKAQIRSFEEEIYTQIDKKANISNINDIKSMVGSKVDQTAIASAIQQKASVTDVENVKISLERIVRDLGYKAEAKDLENHVLSTKGAIEDINKEILLKANIKDVCTLLDLKANIDDVNKALTDVHKELDVKSNNEELTTALNDQALINEALCAENCVARWIWKSGEVKSGYAVPWEVQSVNTCPDNFLWEKDKTSVLTVAPGLYEITFGFFAKKKPTVQLLINGEPVLSAVNSASYVIHHSSGKLKNVGRHSAGNITGLTLIDFIALPARARLSLSFDGEAGAEGFLGLRKL